MVAGSRSSSSAENARPCSSAIGLNVCTMLSRRSASGSALVSSWTVLDSTLARSRMSLSSLSRSTPDERMTWAYSTWRSVRLPSGLSSSCSASTSRLLSGVRSSWDMLAMNSDLYREETDSSRAFSSTNRFASSTSWYLPSTSLFLSASSFACAASSSLD